MSILFSEKINSKFTFQLVNGDHIMKSYMIDSVESVGSCMMGDNITKFYSFVEGLSMMRVLKKGGHLAARALLWETKNVKGETIKLLDRLYSIGKTDYSAKCGCPSGDHDCPGKPYEEQDLVYNYILNNWQKYANVRSSNQQLLVKVRPSYVRSKLLNYYDLPDMDTFGCEVTKHEVRCFMRKADEWDDDDDSPIVAMSNRNIGRDAIQFIIESKWV